MVRALLAGVLLYLDDGKPCDNFVQHPTRKQCKRCLKTKENHPLTEQDAEAIKHAMTEHLGTEEPVENEQYAWVPHGCPISRLDEFFKKFPADQVPKQNTLGDKKRLQRLVYQVPLQDVSPAAYRFVQQESMDEVRSFTKNLLHTKSRIGTVVEWESGMFTQCPTCLLMLEPGDLVVTSSERDGPCYHPSCFQCYRCKTFLTDLIHCVAIDGSISCVRHYCESVKKSESSTMDVILREEVQQAVKSILILLDTPF